MMSWIITGMIAVSLFFALITGNTQNISTGAINGSLDAVQLSITLLGGMCLWSGVMKVAEKAGLVDVISKAILPITRRLFKGVEKNKKLLGAISMNITANLLGLGNAATPLGLAAMEELRKENRDSDEASANMITFVVLNTASITLIPTTVATLRTAHGSQSPLDILPAVWAVSLFALLCALSATKLCGLLRKRRGKSTPKPDKRKRETIQLQ